MTLSIEEMLAKRPVDGEHVEAHMQRMLAEIRENEQRERERPGATQAD
ncbi:hypothetical protein [Microbacterium caowuchunii]|nr:hypothetical protein [Microbacterium caowuchunii]